MCTQIYRRCICGHRENSGSPKRCEKTKKASRIWCYLPFAGPKLDGNGYCLKKKEDSFGVPEPCKQCKAEGGCVNRVSGPAPTHNQAGAGLNDLAYYYGSSQRQAPLPPPTAHMPPSFYSNERQGRAQSSSASSSRRDNTQAQQSQAHQAPVRRPSRYENPRKAPLPPSRSSSSSKYVSAQPDRSGPRRQSEEHVRKTLREAEKVSKDTKKNAAHGKINDKVEDIRARALAKARQEKQRHAEPPSVRHSGNSGISRSRSSASSAYPAPLNLGGHRHATAAPAGNHAAVYPDLRDHPAMRPDVGSAAHRGAFTAGTRHDEDPRRVQEAAVFCGALTHPDRRLKERSTRDARQYATRIEVDCHRQQLHAAPRGGGRGGVDENGVSPLTYSPPESQISAINVAQKLPYIHRRR